MPREKTITDRKCKKSSNIYEVKIANPNPNPNAMNTNSPK